MKGRVWMLTLLLTMAFSWVFQAEGISRVLTAVYGVQINYNGQVLTGGEPFIVNGTTYVPLRMLMEAFGDKNIDWDGVNNRVLISSRLGPMEDMFMQQLVAKNLEVTNLQNRIKALEAENAKLKGVQGDKAYIDGQIEDLAEELDDRYEEYDDKDFAITLSGDEDDIELVVDCEENDWDNLTESEQKTFMKAICEDIWEEFPKAEIRGYIEEDHKTLVEFEVEPGKAITLVASLDIPEIQEDLNADYGDYNDMDIAITLTGNEDKVTLVLEVDREQWEAMTVSAQEDLLDDIHSDIWYVLEEADINGTVKAGSTTLASYHLEADERVDL